MRRRGEQSSWTPYPSTLSMRRGRPRPPRRLTAHGFNRGCPRWRTHPAHGYATQAHMKSYVSGYGRPGFDHIDVHQDRRATGGHDSAPAFSMSGRTASSCSCTFDPHWHYDPPASRARSSSTVPGQRLRLEDFSNARRYARDVSTSGPLRREASATGRRLGRVLDTEIARPPDRGTIGS